MEANECSGESLYSVCSSTPSATGTAVTECSGESLYSACSSTPSATGTAATECSGKSLYHALACVKPGLDYFISKYTGDLSKQISAFQAARHFVPHKIV